MLERKASGEMLRTLLMLLVCILPLAFSIQAVGAAEASVAGKMVNPLSGDNNFNFNSTIYPVNTDFTVEFYVSDVTNMIAWQINISWNDSVLHNSTAWIPGVDPYPGTNVFTEALNGGATPLVPPASVDIDLATNTGYLLYAMTTWEQYAVNVTGSGLLCKVNFTIAVSAGGTDILSTNINLITGNPPSYDSCVFVPPGNSRIKISAEPAIVRVHGPDAPIAEFPSTTLLSLLTLLTTLAAILARKMTGKLGDNKLKSRG